MNERKRMMALVGALLVALVVAVIIIPRSSQPEKPPPSTSGYYTGPMKNKSGRDEYSTEDNKLVAKPQGAAASETSSALSTE